MTSMLAVALLAAAALVEAERVRLEYSTPEGCPDVQAFRESVVARLQRVPFSEDAKRVLDVKVERDPGGTLRARLAFREPDGSMGGERTLLAPAGSCEEFGESIALAASIALEPSFASAPKIEKGWIVLDPATVGVDDERARLLAEFLRAELRSNGERVVERSAMSATACGGDLDCAAQEARRRGVDRAVLLAYERLDRNVVTTAIVVDAATGQRVHAERVAVDSLDRLMRPRDFARGLIRQRPLRPEPTVIGFGFEGGMGWYRQDDGYRRDNGVSWAGASSFRADFGLPKGLQLRTRADLIGGGYSESHYDEADGTRDDEWYDAIGSFGFALRYNGPRGAFTGGIAMVAFAPGAFPFPILAARFGPEYGLHGTISLLDSRDYVSSPLAAGLGWGFGNRSRAWAGAVAGMQGPGVRFEADFWTGRRFILSPSVAAGYHWFSLGENGDGFGSWVSAGLSFSWHFGESNRGPYEGDLLTR